VDVVFETGTTPPADTTPPTVTATSPAAGATGVAASTGVSATFTEDLQPGTASIAVSGPTGAVTGSTGYSSGARTLTFTPSSPLAASATYTATVSSARDLAGNTMTPVTWSFTTAASPSTTGCPCTIWDAAAVPAVPADSDTAAVELGVKFRATQNGSVTGIRFYKGPGNGGTHVGSLWSRTGTRLASATFSGESTSGWQQVLFTSPVPVTAGTTYVASYHAPQGRYSVTESAFSTAATTRGPLSALANGTDGVNGVYRYGAGGFPSSGYLASNYWVDVVFMTG
jgi:hypothetical protein